MPRVLASIVTAALLLALALLAGPPAPAARPQPAGEAPRAAPQYIGVASCAAAGCHNAGGPAGQAGSEYGTWVSQDPHARAFQVLYDERSERMVRNLYNPSHKLPAAETPLCLKCHATGEAAAKEQFGERFQLSDGVGCEGCHGPAEHYLTTHYRQAQKSENAARGMKYTKALADRAHLCNSS